MRRPRNSQCDCVIDSPPHLFPELFLWVVVELQKMSSCAKCHPGLCLCDGRSAPTLDFEACLEKSHTIVSSFVLGLIEPLLTETDPEGSAPKPFSTLYRLRMLGVVKPQQLHLAFTKNTPISALAAIYHSAYHLASSDEDRAVILAEVEHLLAFSEPWVSKDVWLRLFAARIYFERDQLLEALRLIQSDEMQQRHPESLFLEALILARLGRFDLASLTAQNLNNVDDESIYNKLIIIQLAALNVSWIA